MSISVVAYGIMVAIFTAVLFLSCMFHCFIMRMHWFQPPDPAQVTYSQWSLWGVRQPGGDGLDGTKDSNEVSVVMPGEDAPTHLARPNPMNEAGDVEVCSIRIPEVNEEEGGRNSSDSRQPTEQGAAEAALLSRAN